MCVDDKTDSQSKLVKQLKYDCVVWIIGSLFVKISICDAFSSHGSCNDISECVMP